MLEWLDTIIQGLLLGGLYALFAIGLSITYGVMRLVNIAHGDFLVLAAYLALGPVLAMHLHPFVAIVPVAVAMFCLGYALQRVLLNRTMGSNFLAPLLATFGLSIILRNALLQIFKSDSRSFQIGDLSTDSIQLGPISVGAFPLIVFLVAICLTVLVSLLFSRTRIGIALRATSDDADTAGLSHPGSPYLCSRNGDLIRPHSGRRNICRHPHHLYARRRSAALLYAFEAVVIGGLGSLWAHVVRAVILGVAQGIGARIDVGLGVLAGHLVFLAVLFFKPTGLFARTN